ncbi:MAG: hypothetical protein WC054_08180 [Candidatus Nanopelagicales bacterium]
MKSLSLRKPALIVALTGAAALTIAGCSSSSSPTTEATPEVSVSSGEATAGAGQKSLEPVTFTSPVAYPSGLTVEIVKSNRVTVAAQGPGEVSEPGVSFELKLTNKSGEAIDLNNVAVTVYYGKEKTPASPAPTSGIPFSGTLGAGMTAEASYVFGLPSGADPVELQFSYKTSEPVAVFVGKI